MHHWNDDDTEGGEDFELDLDMAGVEQKKWPTAPGGIYRVRVVGVQKKPTKSGNEQISLRTEIVCDKAGNDEHKGVTVWDNWMLLPQSRWYMQAGLQALGFPDWQAENLRLRSSDLIDLEGMAMVELDSWEGGDPRNKVKKWIAPKDEKDYSMEPTL